MAAVGWMLPLWRLQTAAELLVWPYHQLQKHHRCAAAELKSILLE
jgi:hypothetical protein